jgi:CheY-like chemotaxis protein
LRPRYQNRAANSSFPAAASNAARLTDEFEASTRIRKHPRTQTVPILAATALCRDKDRANCLASGCDDYIAKPFTHKELGSHIHRLLKDV